MAEEKSTGRKVFFIVFLVGIAGIIIATEPIVHRFLKRITTPQIPPTGDFPTIA